jgi:tetratricopeptide (TPR) repeat protein
MENGRAMKEILLLAAVPMLVLLGVMMAVFRLSDGYTRPEAPSQEKTALVEGAGLGDEVPVKEGEEQEARPPTSETGGAALPAGIAGTQPAGERIAEAVDDWVNVNRTRARRDQATQLGLAKRALATSRPAEAIAACDRVLKAHPDNVDALSAKASALVMMDRIKEACAVYERLIELRRDDLRVRYNYAVVLSRLKRFGDATRNYEFVLAHQPDHAKAMYNLAVILQDEGKLTDAVRLWKRVTDASPQLASAWFNLGVVSLRLASFAAAVKAFTRAEELEPGRADTRSNLAIAQHELGQLAEAIASFQRAREVKPKYLPAVNGIAEVYLAYCEKNPTSDEHFECGVRWCDYSLGIDPSQPRLRRLLERAVKVRPGSWVAKSSLAQALAATPAGSANRPRNRARALELCRESLEANPDQPETTALLKHLTEGSGS